jgi:hypothetical protein
LVSLSSRPVSAGSARPSPATISNN